MQDTYKSIKYRSKGYYKDKGSKFIAYAFPVQCEEEAKKILAEIKKEHHSARHHCFAWRLGKEKISNRANDDGEPSSTAGKPILGQLNKYELTNVIVVVVRYFGGTLLGTAGLIKAYRSAAADALEKSVVITNTIEDIFRLSYSYEEMNEVMRIIKQENINIVNTQFEDTCQLYLSVRKSRADMIEELFGNFKEVSVEKMPDQNIIK